MQIFFSLPFFPREHVESHGQAPQGQPQPAPSFPQPSGTGLSGWQHLAVFPSLASLLLPASGKQGDVLLLSGVSLQLYFGHTFMARLQHVDVQKAINGYMQVCICGGVCRCALKGVCGIVGCCSQHVCVSNQRQRSTWRISPSTQRATARVRTAGKVCV